MIIAYLSEGEETGLTTVLVWVKAHIRLEGNEKAAKEAAEKHENSGWVRTGGLGHELSARIRL